MFGGWDLLALVGGLVLVGWGLSAPTQPPHCHRRRVGLYPTERAMVVTTGAVALVVEGALLLMAL